MFETAPFSTERKDLEGLAGNPPPSNSCQRRWVLCWCVLGYYRGTGGVGFVGEDVCEAVVRGIWEEGVIFGWGGCWVREWGGSMRAGWSGCPEGGRRKRCEGVGKGELLMVSGCDHYDLWSR